MQLRHLKVRIIRLERLANGLPREVELQRGAKGVSVRPTSQVGQSKPR
jgi:hypothetical protein